jgi:TIR domain
LTLAKSRLFIQSQSQPQIRRYALVASRERQAREDFPPEKKVDVDAQKPLPELDDSPYEYDVFLCHNNKEKVTVESIDKKLRKRQYNKQRKIITWMDKRDLSGGDNLTPELVGAIRKSKCAAVFIGENGLGPTQTKELNVICQECNKRKLRVIAVILPKCKLEPDLMPCIFDKVRVDFNKLEDEPLDQLVKAIKKGASN